MRKKYNVKDSAIVLLLTIISPIIVSLFLSVLFILISKLTGIASTKITSNPFVYVGIMCCTQGTFLAIFFAYNKTKKIKFSEATGINKKLSWLQILIICLLTVGALFLFLPLINMFDSLIRSWGFTQSGDLPFKIDNVGTLILGLIFLALLPAICEESVFRGIVFNGLKNKNKVLAVVLSAVAFSLMHMSLQQTVYPLLLGTTFAIIVLITGNIKGSVIAHFVNNAIVVVSQFVSSFSTQSESAYILDEKNILIALGLAIVGALFIWGMAILLKKATKRNKKNQNDETEIQNLANEKNEVAITEKQTTDSFDLSLVFVYLFISLIIWIINNAMYF